MSNTQNFTSNVVSISSGKEAPTIETHLGQSQNNKVIGLDGRISEKPLTYLDSTASALAESQIQNEMASFLKKGYANTHTTGHHRGRDSTDAVNAARDSIGKFMGYNKEKDMVLFSGTGATGPLNYLAQVLFPKTLHVFNNSRVTKKTKDKLMEALSPKEQRMAKEMMAKPIVITTEMEHHANQLPWFDNENLKIVPVNSKTGELDIETLKELLEEHKGKIRLVTVSGASNITGIMNPIHNIARMVHDAGAEICIDGAQLAPHHKIEKNRPDPKENLDYIVMSPHKFGVPNTPGVLVANRSLLDGRRNLVTLGGGMVDAVTTSPAEFLSVKEYEAGEEPGTPNIAGIIATGLAAANLTRNMAKLEAHEKELTHDLMHRLQQIGNDDIEIIGSKDPEKRVGVVSFEVKGIPHPIVTAFLNDHWNIAVRNGCFCAHPLIIKMSGLTDIEMDKVRKGDRSDMPGYIRASFGEHSTTQDINTLVEALTELVQNKDQILSLYDVDSHGNAIRKDGFSQPRGWAFDEAVQRSITSKDMESIGYNTQEIASLLPVFQGTELASLMRSHDNAKSVIQKVNDEVNQHPSIKSDDKISAIRDILLNIYDTGSLQNGAHAAKAKNQPLYTSETGKTHTIVGWEQSIKSMVSSAYAPQSAVSVSA